MEPVLNNFKSAFTQGNGYDMAECLTPVAPKDDAGLLYGFYRSTNHFSVQGDIRSALTHNSRKLFVSKQESDLWVDVFVAYWKAVGEILHAEELSNQPKGPSADWNKVYNAWKDMLNALLRGYANSTFPAWSIPCLYVAARYLRIFAIKADEQTEKTKGAVTFSAGLSDDLVSSVGKNEKLEDATRQINRIYGICSNDRAPLDDSRKWGLYYFTNLMFKCHFKLNSISLSKTILKSLTASAGDMPPLNAFPKSHQVTFLYYTGVIHFLEENYAQAEENLTKAKQLCLKSARKNQELIMTYLIPCHLLTTHTLPTMALLGPYPRLQKLFLPLAACIKKGDLAGFDAALAASEREFVKRRIFLSMERGREIALRNLFRKVFIAGGYEPLKEGETSGTRVRRTRVPLKEFTAAMRLSLGLRPEDELSRDEVECMLANLIYKDNMKGYIARDAGMVVLSKKGAFPGTGV